MEVGALLSDCEQASSSNFICWPLPLEKLWDYDNFKWYSTSSSLPLSSNGSLFSRLLCFGELNV